MLLAAQTALSICALNLLSELQRQNPSAGLIAQNQRTYLGPEALLRFPRISVDETVECMKLDLERDLTAAPYELLDISTTGRCIVGAEAKV